jgi:hypothetical protein
LIFSTSVEEFNEEGVSRIFFLLSFHWISNLLIWQRSWQYATAGLLVSGLSSKLKERIMAKKGGKKLAGKSLKSQKSLKLAANHNEIVLRG